MHRTHSWLVLLFLVPPAHAKNAPQLTTKPAVVFREDFEHFDKKNWDDFGEAPDAVRIVDSGHNGGKCAQITATLGKDTGGHLYKMLEPGLDICHLRFYVRFEKGHGYVHHFVQLVGYNPPTRWPQGGAGERPKGGDRFSTGIEPWGDWGKFEPPGAWNKADGEQALWIDGKEVGRWGKIKWRTDPKLKVNGVWIMQYITELARDQNHFPRQPNVNRVWFDDIVVSPDYIGPTP
jgi:hypothetical protein